MNNKNTSTKAIVVVSVTLIVSSFAFFFFHRLEISTPSQPIKETENHINIDTIDDHFRNNRIVALGAIAQEKIPIAREEDSTYSEYPPKVRNLLIEITRPLTLKEQQQYQNEMNEFKNLAFSDHHRIPINTLKEFASNGDGFAHYALSMRNTEIDDMNILESHAIEAIKSNYPAHRSIGLLLSLKPETRSRGLAYLLLAHNQKSISAKKQLLHRFKMAPVSTEDLKKALAMVPELQQQLSE